MCADRSVVRRGPDGPTAIVGARARQTHDRICDAAIKTFSRYGYQDSRIEDVAQSARTARATVYQYFENKEQILRALSGRMGAQLLALADGLPPIDETAMGLERLAGFVRDLMMVSQIYAPVVETWFDPGSQSDVLHTSGDRFMRDFAERVAAAFEGCGARAEGQAALTASLLFAVVDAVSRELVDKSLETTPQVAANQIARIFHRAIFAP